MINSIIKNKIHYILNYIITFYYCFRSGIPFDKSYQFRGRIRVIKKPFYANKKSGKIKIGKSFIVNNKLTSNSIGLIQPCIFNISNENSEIIIGNNVGISGSTLNASKSIVIGDNVLIGSGCIVSDTDSHPLNLEDRINNNIHSIKSGQIIIKDNVFIGARCVILKSVTIGEGAIIGACSVITKDIPAHTIYAGNPAKFIRNTIDKNKTQA